MLCNLIGIDHSRNVLLGQCEGYQREFELDIDHCTVTLNGYPADWGDLQGGDRLEVDGQPAVEIRAVRQLTPEQAREQKRYVRDQRRQEVEDMRARAKGASEQAQQQRELVRE